MTELTKKESKYKDHEVGYSKDNNGNLIKAYPIIAVGNYVIAENRYMDYEEESISRAGIKRSKKEKMADPVMLGKWTIVAIGDRAKTLYPHLEIGASIGVPNDIYTTKAIQHPLLANGIREGMYDEKTEAYDVENNLHFRYASFDASLISMFYATQEEL